MLVVCASCATPSSPTGGPADEEGPKIVEMEPESGTTNFTGREIKLSFSEFVNRGSLRNAIAVEPDIGIEYSLDWGRKSVAIEFRNRLPDTTTIIVTIGTELQDTKNNKLSEPVRIAVSTGPDIDQGEIYGRIVDSRTGKGTSGNRVFLYRAPVDLTRKADYTAETDTSGRFHFSYLRQGEYKAFWVADQNRNKLWEQERERAQPFNRETVTLEKAGTDTLSRLFLANPDTTKPTLQGVGLFSSRRIRLRFSENIGVVDSTRLFVEDTLGNRYAEALPLYISPNESYVLFAHSRQALAEGGSYRMVVRHIEDESGNRTGETSFDFEGSSQRDTTLQRIIKIENSPEIYPSESLEVVYAKPITDSAIQDSLTVVEGTELHRDWGQAEVEQNRLRILPPVTGSWQQGLNYEIRAWDPTRQAFEKITPTIWYSADLGNIAFALADTADRREYRLSLINEKRGTVADTVFSGSVEIPDLPPLEYRVIIYSDLDGDGFWDQGRVEPYRAPEPYFIQNRIPVEEGFTADVTVIFD